MHSRWSDLQPELLQIISAKQTNFVDYLSTRAVCKSWRFALPKRPSDNICQLPWMLLPYHRNNTNYRGFYNLADRKIYNMELPEGIEKRSCGSSQGWLIMVDDINPSIFLLNPLTKAKIELPTLSTFPNFPTDVIYENCRNWRENCVRNAKLRMQERFIKKAIVSADPSLVTSFMAAAIYGEDQNLAFCRSGDVGWSVLQETSSPPPIYKDVMFHAGNLYAVDEKGHVSILKCTDNSPATATTHVADPPPVPPTLGYKQWYLATLDEDLLLFGRFRKYNVPRYEYQTSRFVAYRLNGGSSDWTEVKSLGNRMFFLGWNSSHYVSTSECQGNCIYFTDDHFRICTDFLWEGHDFGVFNFGDGTVLPRLGLTLYPTKMPRRPNVWHYEESMKRDFSVFALPPPLWVTISP